jgi:hypothetical protein
VLPAASLFNYRIHSVAIFPHCRRSLSSNHFAVVVLYRFFDSQVRFLSSFSSNTKSQYLRNTPQSSEISFFVSQFSQPFSAHSAKLRPKSFNRNPSSFLQALGLYLLSLRFCLRWLRMDLRPRAPSSLLRRPLLVRQATRMAIMAKRILICRLRRSLRLLSPRTRIRFRLP